MFPRHQSQKTRDAVRSEGIVQMQTLPQRDRLDFELSLKGKPVDLKGKLELPSLISVINRQENNLTSESSILHSVPDFFNG